MAQAIERWTRAATSLPLLDQRSSEAGRLSLVIRVGVVDGRDDEWDKFVPTAHEADVSRISGWLDTTGVIVGEQLWRRAGRGWPAANPLTTLRCTG